MMFSYDVVTRVKKNRNKKANLNIGKKYLLKKNGYKINMSKKYFFKVQVSI